MHFRQLERRELITLLGRTAAAWPLAARAELSEPRMRRIGVLMHATADETDAQARLAAFLQGLQVAGWEVGRDVRVNTRWSKGNGTQLFRDAEELILSEPDAVLAGVGATAPALQQASRVVPIVFAQGIDPVGAGYVESLAQPGGNATGFIQFEYSLAGQWLKLLKEIAPRVSSAAVLREPGTAGVGQWVIIQAVARSLGVVLRPITLTNGEEIERAVMAFAGDPNGGLIVVVSAASLIHHDLIVALAARFRLPTAYPYRSFGTSGGLITYGPDIIDLYRRAAGYVDRILKGERPADLPVQAPTKYELVINLKTARVLGLEVPPSLLARADEVIE